MSDAATTVARAATTFVSRAGLDLDQGASVRFDNDAMVQILSEMTEGFDMSRRIRAVLSVVGTTLLTGALPAQSAPLMPDALVTKSAAANANILEVRFGGWGGWRGGWGGWRGGWGGWGWGAGALAGVAVGAAIAAPYYYGGYYPSYYAAPYPYDYGYPGYYAGYYPYGYRPYWRHYYWAHPYQHYGWYRAHYDW